jgi:hypothetical protein
MQFKPLLTCQTRKQQVVYPSLIKALLMVFFLGYATSLFAKPINYRPPIVITKGGTYTGNWESRSSSVPAVTIDTQEPVIIENANIRGAGHLIFTKIGEANVTVRNCRGYALTPTVDGRPPGRFVNARKPRRLVIENNYMEGTSGNYVYKFVGSGSGSEVLKIVRNKVRNVSGKHRDGVNRSIIHFVQFNAVRHLRNAEIAWNELINEPGKTAGEENINMYNSSGVSGDPIRIHNNFIKGAYPVNPMASYYPGGGILCDGKDQGSLATAYVHAYENVIVSTTNHGMGIAGGNNNRYYNNRVISSGLFENGVVIPAQGTGVWMRNYHNTPSDTWYNNSISNNYIGWVNLKRSGGRLDLSWACTNCPNNTALPNPITLETEKNEYRAWQSRCASKGISVGPASNGTNKPPQVQLSSPVANASIKSGSNIALGVSASDADGSVRKVEYFRGSTKIGETTTSPFSFTWSNVSAGSYTLYARATDDDGASTNSTATAITVTTSSAVTTSGSLLRELWTNVSGKTVASIPVSTAPASTNYLTLFEEPRYVGDNFGTRIRGYVLPPQTGNYIFWIAGDDNCELWISEDENPANKVRIASVSGYTGYREWTKYSSQKSATVRLEAGRRYYVEALHKEASGGDHLSVGWQLPDGDQERPILGNRIEPFQSATTSPGTIVREYWPNITGDLISSIPVDTPPSSTTYLSLFEAPRNVGDSYGTRIRGYVLPPQDGEYTFWIAGDNSCELWLSTDQNPANKERIAFSTSYTSYREWTRFSSQKSAKIQLKAGQRYYVEVLHKERTGNDHVSVGWQLPNGTLERPMPGNRIAPVDLSEVTASRTSASHALAGSSETLADELVEEEISVYPNPTVDKVTIAAPAEPGATVTVTIMDGVGKTVFEEELLASGQEVRTELDLEQIGLKAGLYLVRVESGAFNRVARVVKQK